MTTRDKLIEEARKGVQLKSSELASRWGVSRQTVSGHLSRLVEEGLLEKSGSTRKATYVLAGGAPEPPASEFEAADPASRERVEHGVPSAERSPTPSNRWTWSGASLASAALAVAVLVVLALQSGGDQPREPSPSGLEGESTAAAVGPPGETPDRMQTIGADRQLALANMNVVAGTEVTLQAGRMVALGDGFSVDRNAALVVKIEDPPKR